MSWSNTQRVNIGTCHKLSSQVLCIQFLRSVAPIADTIYGLPFFHHSDFDL